MAATYDPSLATDKDRVRFLIGDNAAGKMLLDDAEIEWLLTTEANVWMAAAAAADSLAQKVSTAAGTTSGAVQRKRIGATDISYATGGRTSADYTALASTLRARGRSHQVPFAGGISVADKQLRNLDPDRPADGFRRGMHDAPGSWLPSTRDD